MSGRRTLPPPRWSDSETAWLAGLLEGEGCFSFIRRPKGPASVGIWLTMADHDVVGRAAKMMNSQTHSQDRGGKTYWRTSPGGYLAVDVMRRIEPHMGARRRDRIAELLEHWDFHHPPADGNDRTSWLTGALQ